MIYLLLISTALVCGMILLAGRWKRCVAGAVVSAALIAGCATAPAKESTVFDCAPKGYERLDGWELRDTRSGLATATEDGQPIMVIAIFLSRGATEFLTLTLLGNVLIAVDPAPQDLDVPLLLNTRYFTADNKLRAKPEGACGWRQLLVGETAMIDDKDYGV